VGVTGLTQGLIEIANCSREMKTSEKKQAKANTGKDPVEFVVGYDAMAIYVHKDNPIEEISVGQLAAIYGEGGDVDKWSQLGIKLGGGSDKIVRVSRQNSSGTYFFFREHVLNKKDYKSGSCDMSGSKDVVELVGKTLGAIGYSGMGYKTDAVKFVRIAGKKGEKAWAPTLENVKAGHYTLARPLRMYTLGQPEGHVRKYMDWVLSEDGQAIVERSGYIPVASAGGEKKE
jgi:phosphate transport system substrate-binding protein